MVINSMLVFQIIINLADLQYVFVICFVNIELELLSKIQTTFWCKTAIINFVVIIKFFFIICDAIFMFLFDVDQAKKKTFRTNIELFYYY